MLTERERRIARQAYQAGYGRGHNDTVEGCYNGVCETEDACADEWLEEWQENESSAVHPMLAAAFAAGWQSGVEDYQNEADAQRRRDECIGRYGA